VGQEKRGGVMIFGEFTWGWKRGRCRQVIELRKNQPEKHAGKLKKKQPARTDLITERNFDAKGERVGG